MPPPRLLLSQSLFTQQWLLRNILRLPVELRPLVFHTFSSLASRHDNFAPIPRALDSSSESGTAEGDISSKRSWKSLNEDKNALEDLRSADGTQTVLARDAKFDRAERQGLQQRETEVETSRLGWTESGQVHFPMSAYDGRARLELNEVNARLETVRNSNDPNGQERLSLELRSQELHLEKNRNLHIWAEAQRKRAADLTAEQSSILNKILRKQRRHVARSDTFKKISSNGGDYETYLSLVQERDAEKKKTAEGLQPRLDQLKKTVSDNAVASDAFGAQQKLVKLKEAFRTSVPYESQNMNANLVVDNDRNQKPRTTTTKSGGESGPYGSVGSKRNPQSDPARNLRKLNHETEETTFGTGSHEAVSQAQAPTLGKGENSVAEVVPIIDDLRRQVQELTDLVSALVPKDRPAKSAARLLSSTLVPKTKHPLARETEEQSCFSSALPHELDLEVPVPQPSLGSQTWSSSTSSFTALGAGHSAATSTTTALTGDIESLYDSLFPEENSSTQRATPDITKEVARLPIPEPLSKNTQDPNIRQSSVSLDQKRGNEQLTVLTLRNASKALTEDDFRRAMPRGKHLKEWASKGAFTRVIPVREPWSMEQTGDFYIVFSNPTDADVFLKHVRRVFELTKLHTPTSLLSPLPPGPSYLKDKSEEEADEHELVRNFSLIPPNQSSVLTLEKEKLHAANREQLLAIWRRGGYPQALVSGEARPGCQVLVEMVGSMMPNWYQLRDAINRDGTRRNLPWELLPGDLGIRKVEMQKPTNKSLEGQGGLVGFQASSEAEERLARPKHGQKWILAFQQKEEASRFARKWNRRKFPWGQGERPKDFKFRGNTMVRCELLW